MKYRIDESQIIKCFFRELTGGQLFLCDHEFEGGRLCIKTAGAVTLAVDLCNGSAFDVDANEVVKPVDQKGFFTVSPRIKSDLPITDDMGK